VPSTRVIFYREADGSVPAKSWRDPETHTHKEEDDGPETQENG